MKIHRLTRRVSAIPGTWTALAALASLIVSSSSAYSQTAAAPTPTEQKEYTLFIGGNLEIPQDKAFFPVKKVLKNDLEVEVNKSIRRVSIDDVREYKVVREAKLASVSAKIDITRSDRTLHGSTKAALEALSNGIAIQNNALDSRDRSLGKVVIASTRIRQTDAMASSMGAVDTNAASAKDGDVNKAIDDASKAMQMNDLTNLTYTSQQAMEQGGKDMADALEVELQVSSPKPLSGAHIVFVTECHEATKPTVMLRMITPKFLGDIGSKPVKVSFEQNGFPVGYVLDRERVFLYAEGSEIVTNLSDNRVEMTREQAFRYLLVQYIASHSKDSLPPTPIMGAAPADFRYKVDAAQLSQTVSLSISKNGEVTAIALEDGGAKLSPTVEIALKNFRFFPSLQNGLPTEGKMKAKLSDLFRNT